MSRPRRTNSSDLSFYGESSRDLLDFSRYLDEDEVGKPQSLEKPSSVNSKDSDILPSAFSTSSPQEVAGGTMALLNSSDHLKIPRFIEMTNTQPLDDILDSPLSGERCSPRHMINSNTDSYDCWPKCQVSSVNATHQETSSLQYLSLSGKVLPQKSPTDSALSSCSSLDEPSCQRTKSSKNGSCTSGKDDDDDSHNNNNPTCRRRHSTHSLHWDRAMVQVVPGYSLPLAGTQESIAAYQRQAVQEIVCPVCQTELFCIDTASMVLCPECCSFSSICAINAELEPQLGLGLTVKLLAEEIGNL